MTQRLRFLWIPESSPVFLKINFADPQGQRTDGLASKNVLLGNTLDLTALYNGTFIGLELYIFLLKDTI
jgi:hypothetical protein